MIMCAQGGFLGGYAVVARKGHFANAQTNNIVSLVSAIVGRDWKECSLRILALLVYSAAIVICSILTERKHISMEKYAFAVSALGVIGLAFIPENIDPFVAVLPIFFMASTQWSVFHGTDKYACATIFSTNNLRQCLTALVEYIYSHEDAKLEKCLFYFSSILFFTLGAAIAAILCELCGVKASLFSVIIIILGAFSNVSSAK